MYKTKLRGVELKGTYNELARVVADSGLIGNRIEKIK
jgi:hypothetical protein